MAKRKQYAKIAVNNGYLEYHTGPDREAVRGLRSLNAKFKLEMVNSPEAVETMALRVEQWFLEISVYELEVLP